MHARVNDVNAALGLDAASSGRDSRFREDSTLRFPSSLVLNDDASRHN